jgi:3-phenylpropionate/trans-cinnamate dioxygenase ferredoxin subunit
VIEKSQRVSKRSELFDQGSTVMFQAAARIEDIPAGTGKVVQIGQRKVLVVNVDGDFHGLDSFCTQRGAPLVKGAIIEGQLLCPWHGNPFDVIKGVCTAAPEESVRIYPVEVRQGQVWVAVEEEKR